MARHFMEMLHGKWREKKFVCVGLDPVFEQLPENYRNSSLVDPAEALLAFCCELVDATKAVAAAYKPNSAFFEAEGWQGVRALMGLCEYIRRFTEVPVIVDVKRGDIGHSSEAYARYAYEQVGADAVTVSPYLGKDSVAPFFRETKGAFVLCRTSNPGSAEFQVIHTVPNSWTLYHQVAAAVEQDWSQPHGNVGLVAGATHASDIGKIRRAAPSVPLLIPGIGKQGGDLETSIGGALDEHQQGFLINSSRAIAESPNPDQAVDELNQQILGAISVAA